jgi:chromosome segregation ATPase
MVSTKGYWDMINEHINESDLEYLESKEVIRQRKELKKNWLGKDELYQFEIAQMQKQIQNLYIRIKELNEEIYELRKGGVNNDE